MGIFLSPEEGGCKCGAPPDWGLLSLGGQRSPDHLEEEGRSQASGHLHPPYSPHHTPRLCPTEVPAATLPWAHSLCLFPPPSALLSSFCPCPVIFSLGSLVQDFLPLPSSLGPVLRRCLQPTPPKPLTQPFHQVWLPSHTLISACHPILGAYFSGFLIYHLCLSQLLPGPSGSFSSP